MKLKEYMALCQPGTEITCWDKDVDSEFYFYVKETDNKLLYGDDFPNVDKCMKRLTEILDVVKIHDTGVIEVNLYEKLEHPEVIRYAKENFYEEHQYEDDAGVVMLLFDDNDKNISQGFEEFSRMMVECLDLAYGPEKTIDENKIKIDLGFATLVAEKGADPNYNEIFIGLEDLSGVWSQDIAVIGEKYHYEEDKVVSEKGISVKLYSDKDQEDYTHNFDIDIYESDEYIAEHNKSSLDDQIHAAEIKSSLQSSEKSTPDIEPSR